MLPKIIDYLKDKSVLILGFGREGQSTLEYIRKYLPEKELTVADRNFLTIDDKFVKTLCGENYLDSVNSFELVMKSPGISFKNVDVHENTEVSCQVDMFLRFAECKKVGITGSKGKTTTSTLTYEMLKASGFDARLIGNIGVPVFNTLEDLNSDTIAVIEMSSHQLEFTRKSPDVAVLTNIYEEHLDHYKGGFTGYVNAKLNIVRHQNENNLFIYNKDQGISDYISLDEIKSKTFAASKDDKLPFPINNEHLLGEHTRQDVVFAYNAAKFMGAGDEGCKKGVENFKGIEHRMEKVATHKGITFYNDCIATIPHAVECAVAALKNVDTLIFGGKDRGLDYSEFADYLAESNINNLIGTPETGHNICDELLKKGVKKNIIKAEDLDEAVRKAYEFTAIDKICLLSPAASSYNVYKNFEHKGRHYKELIEKYSK